MRMSKAWLRLQVGLACALILSAATPQVFADGKAPKSLKQVEIKESKRLHKFLNRDDHGELRVGDLRQLGKALFWEQAAGSDGMACASCHFHAGADNRTKNQLSPGLNRVDSNNNPNPDNNFEPTASGGMGGPNYTLVSEDFPFHQFNDPDNRHSGVKFSSNDVASSQGTFGGTFLEVPLDKTQINDICAEFADRPIRLGEVSIRLQHAAPIRGGIFGGGLHPLLGRSGSS